MNPAMPPMAAAHVIFRDAACHQAYSRKAYRFVGEPVASANEFVFSQAVAIAAALQLIVRKSAINLSPTRNGTVGMQGHLEQRLQENGGGQKHDGKRQSGDIGA